MQDEKDLDEEQLMMLIIENDDFKTLKPEYKNLLSSLAEKQYNLVKNGQKIGEREQQFLNKYRNEYVKSMDFCNSQENALFKEFAKDTLADCEHLNKEDVTFAAWYFTRMKYAEQGLNVQMEIKEIPRKSKDSITRGLHSHDRKNNIHKITYNEKDYIDKIANAGKSFSKKKNNMFALLWTINHELQHAIQHENYGRETFDYNTLQYAKESICYEEYGKEFYQGNYSNISFEHDANINGYLKTLNDLKEYAPQYAIDFENANIEEKRALTDKFGRGKYEFSIDEEKINQSVRNAVTVGVNAAAKHDWERIIKRYPILLNEYNLDGSKKNYMEILRDKEAYYERMDEQGELYKRVRVHGVEMSKNVAVQKMYASIIASDPLLSIQELESKLVDITLSGKNLEQCDGIKERIKSISKNNTIDYKHLMDYQKKRIAEIDKKSRNLDKQYRHSNTNKITDKIEYFKEAHMLSEERNKVTEIYDEVILSNSKLSEEQKKAKEKEEQISRSKKIIKDKLGIDIDQRTDNSRHGFLSGDKGLIFNGYSEDELFKKLQQQKNQITVTIDNYSPSQKKEMQSVLDSLGVVYEAMTEQRTYESMTKRLETWQKGKGGPAAQSKNSLLEQIRGLSGEDYKKAQEAAEKGWNAQKNAEKAKEKSEPNKEKNVLSSAR